MTITIRALRPADLPVLKDMIRENIDYLNAIDEPEEVSQETIDRVAALALGPDALCSVLIAEMDEQVGGYLLYFVGVDMDVVAPAIHINDLFVREALHRRGIGCALMNAARAVAKQRGAARLFWTVWRKNPKAIAFYRELGAKPWDDEEILMQWPASPATQPER